MNKKKAIAFLIVMAILIALGIVFAFVSLDNGELGKYDYISYPKAIKLGLDLKGGVYAVFEATDDGDENFASRVQGTADRMEALLFDKGYTEATVTVEQGNRIRVEVPDVDDPEEIFDLINRPASLEFKYKDLDGEIVTYKGEDGTLLNGELIESAFVTYDEDSNYAIGLKFNSKGTDLFAEATSDIYSSSEGDYASAGKVLYIYVNGEKLVEPTVSAVITGGNAIITGNYTYETANNMAISIEAGAFSVVPTLIDSDNISATLGADALNAGVLAGVIGIAFIIILMCVLYRLLGLASSISLIMYIMAALFFFAIFPWVQLTLPGVAGVIISIGMAVDANVIIFERIKDEFYNSSKDIRFSVKEGFKKANSAIFDGNITTLLGCIIIYIFGGASLKGFAATLAVGIILSLFFALVMSRAFINSFLAFNDSNNKAFGLVRGGQHE